MLDEYLSLQINGHTGCTDYAPVREPVFRDIVGALLNTGYITSNVEYSDLIK